MPQTGTAIFGVFPERAAASGALETLQTAGFRNMDVSILFSSGLPDEGSGPDEASMLGWLSGIGALCIPGTGPFIAAGPIMAMLGGWGLQGTPSGLTSALVSLGVPEYESRAYERAMRRNGVLVSVHCENEEWERRARSVLEHHGASEISRSAEPAIPAS